MIDVLFFEVLDNGSAGICRAVFLSAAQHIWLIEVLDNGSAGICRAVFLSAAQHIWLRV